MSATFTGDITLRPRTGCAGTTRPDLRIAVMSATLDMDFVGLLPQAAYSRPKAALSPSRSNTKPTQPTRTSGRSGEQAGMPSADTSIPAQLRGDVLVFMPGGFEISQTIDAIRHTDEAKGFIRCRCMANLPNDQDAAVARYPQRKVVVSTNVAETSLTIDGVRLVIDSGLARIPRFDANRASTHCSSRTFPNPAPTVTRWTRGPHRARRMHAALVARGTFASPPRRNSRKSNGSISPKLFSR